MQICGEFMEDLTILSIHASYLLGIGIFLFALAGRRLSAGLTDPLAPPRLIRGNVPSCFYLNADLLGILLFFSLFYALAISNTMVSAGKEATPTALELALRMVFGMGVQLFLPLVAFAIVAQRVGIVEWLGLRWKDWPQVFGIAPLSVFAMFVFGIILHFVGYQEMLKALGAAEEQEVIRMFREESNPMVLALIVLAAVVVAPVCEEIVFRGYLYPAAKKHAGSTVAALFSALVFAGAHGNIAALVPLFVFGLLLVAVYERTGSIWAPIAVHALFNGTTVLIQFILRFIEVPDTIAR